MCSEYRVQIGQKKIERTLGQKIASELDQDEWNVHVKFTLRAPVLQMGKTGPEMAEKVFPANPFPNARLSGVEQPRHAGDDDHFRRIYEVPLWKEGFARNPLLVPMTSFLEPVYWGEQEGSVVEFTIPGEEVFFAAAIAIRPRVPAGGPASGFSLLTHTATKQMLRYHQRLLVVLEAERAMPYLRLSTAKDRFDYLIENRYTGELEARPQRQMARGWQKRREQQRAKLEREERYAKALQQEGIEG